MPADGPVNVNRYTLYAIIPGLDSYAASKLDKKKPATIYTIIAIAGILIFTGMIAYGMNYDSELNSEMDKTERTKILFEKYNLQIIYGVIIFLGIHLPVYAYFVRKWAKEWNEKFASSS